MLRKLAGLIAFLWVVGGAVDAIRAADISESVVLMFQQDWNGSMRFVCTATAIRETPTSKPLFLSAAHCVTEESTKRPGTQEQTKKPIYLTFDNDEDKRYVKARVQTLGSQGDGFDFCLLESLLDAPTLLLGDEKTLKPGSEVASVTAALGLGKSYTRGYVAIPRVDRPLVDGEQSIDWTGGMLLHLPSAGGASGSAIVSVADGRVVGVLVGGIRGLTLAVPVSKLKEVLNPKPSPSTSRDAQGTK